MPNFEPSPTLYNCACAFIWDETQRAYFSGDYSLLARAGFADALEFIANPLNAGTDAAAHSEMLEDYRRSMEAKKARADYYKPAKMINANLPRVEFWRKFEAGADKDDDAMEFRRVFLIDRWGGLLRLMPKIRDMGDLDTYNKLTDALIFPAIDTAENPEPARVRAHWLNHCFSMAGAELARWLSVARLPDFEKQLAELRERIADNFGVFPAPFEYVDADGADVCAPRNVIALAAKIHEHNGNAEKAREARDALAKIPARYYVRRASDELEILLHIARAQARQMSGGEIGTGANPSGTANGCAQGAAADRKPDAGANGGTDGQTAGHIGTWAKAQGATAYIVGVSVCIRGTVCQLPPIDQKRGRVVADLIESEDYLGAVKCDFHSAMGGDTSSAEYEKIAGFVERVNAGKRGKSADRNFSGCWHIKPKPATAE